MLKKQRFFTLARTVPEPSQRLGHNSSLGVPPWRATGRRGKLSLSGFLPAECKMCHMEEGTPGKEPRGFFFFPFVSSFLLSKLHQCRKRRGDTEESVMSGCTHYRHGIRLVVACKRKDVLHASAPVFFFFCLPTLRVLCRDVELHVMKLFADDELTGLRLLSTLHPGGRCNAGLLPLKDS